jgi:DNA-binding transcriptional LysR family regulator
MTAEWSDFKVLLALVRAGSVAGAARALQVDSSTISRRLSALEEAVGARLLIRGGREFTWTAEGRTLIDAGAAMEAAATSALRSVRSTKAEVGGTVRVSVAPGFIPVLVRHLLPALREAHPSWRVELDGGFQRVDLARGDADIALRMARPDEPGLVARHVLDCGWCSRGGVAFEARGRPRSDELARHELFYSEALHRGTAALDGGVSRHARELPRRQPRDACQTIAAAWHAVLQASSPTRCPAARVSRTASRSTPAGSSSRGRAR